MISRSGENVSIAQDELRDLVFQTLETCVAKAMQVREKVPTLGKTEGFFSNLWKNKRVQAQPASWRVR